MFVVCILLILCLPVVVMSQTTVDPLSLGGVQNSPGLIIVLRPKGINSLAQSLGKLIDTQLPKVTLQKADIPLPLVSNGLYSVQQIKITSYSPARLHSLTVLPNDRLNWVSSGFSFTSNGTFAARIFQLLGVPQNAAGTVGIKATNAMVNLTMILNPNNQGQPVITVENCTASTSSAVLDMKVAGVFGEIFDFLQKKPQDSGPLVNHIICDTATYFAESVVNEMFRISPTNSTFVKDKKETGYPSLATGDLVFNYGFKDGRAVKPPKSSATAGYMLDTVGEVSWNNKGGTGFNAPVVDVNSESEAQLDIFLTDYAINSMLYHAYNHKMLDFTLNDKNTTLKQHLLATCPQNNPANPCIGNSLTELPKKYGGQTIQVQLTLSAAPYAIFKPDSKNVLYSSSVVDFIAKNKNGKLETFLSMGVETQGLLTINVNQNGTIGGNLSIRNMTAKILQNLLAANTTAITNNGTTFLKVLWEKMINRRFSQGYQLSGGDQQVFLPLGQQPTIKYGPRVAIISSTLNIDQQKLIKLAGNALINVGAKT